MLAWFVYKHPGHKVVVKAQGDLIVRPTYTETDVMRWGAAQPQTPKRPNPNPKP